MYFFLIIFKDLAGSCKGEDCQQVSEICIPQGPTYTCVPLLEVFAETFEKRTRKFHIKLHNYALRQMQISKIMSKHLPLLP